MSASAPQVSACARKDQIITVFLLAIWAPSRRLMLPASARSPRSHASSARM
jgi:hypothetical protein